MITDLDRTIEKLITAELPIKNGEIDVTFDQPKREWSARLARPTINFFLYDIRENNILRKHQWERMPIRNGFPHGQEIDRKRTPYRVDCHYMITVWASEPEDEHRLLTRCMLALFRYPLLPKNILIGDMKDQPFELQARLASHDKLTNPAEVWSSLDNEMRPSISYIITLAMDPWTKITTPVVRTITMRRGQSATLPYQQSVVEDSVESTVSIGGMVIKGDEPQIGIEVAIKGTGFFGKTDERGVFNLGKLPAGDYVLVAWPPEGKPKERSISVPDSDYNIEL